MEYKEIITKTYSWWGNDDSDIISSNHEKDLHSIAIERMTEMESEGYSSGELIAQIDVREYRGWWDISTENF